MKFWDSWAFRRWAFWLPCAKRRHPPTFHLDSRWNFPDGTVVRHIVRCSCGRRTWEERG